jgi:hypothetical protein
VADDYFDANEVSEYGEYTYNEAAKLEGLSEIFVISKLRVKLRGALDDFKKERIKSAGSLDGVRKDAKVATDEARDVLTRFFSHLGSFKAGVIDKAAFFIGGKLGDIQKLKPAAVQTKLETVLLGFEAKGNNSFKDRDEWLKELTLTLKTLKLSLDTKEDKRTDATRSTAEKSKAYEQFLMVYTQITKPAVAGILAELNRSQEYRLFFLDLQVNETSEAKKTQQEAGKKAAETKKNKTDVAKA